MEAPGEAARPRPAESFAEWQAAERSAGGVDAGALALLTGVAIILNLRTNTEDALLLHVVSALIVVCLACCLSAPASWQRLRVPALVALRLSLAAPSTRLLQSAIRATLSSDGSHASLTGLAAALFFVSTVGVSSGAAGLALVSPGR